MQIYALTETTGSVLSHYAQRLGFVRDIEHDEWLQLKADVSSGDYFATLATRLDELSMLIEMSDPVTAAQLESCVKDLLYLQSNYNIHKK